MAVNETRMVRVATMKASGKRYLLDSFHGAKALLWGELVAFKGLRSEHSGKLRWVDEALFTFKEEKKTQALCMTLLKQAAAADEELSIRIIVNGAKLARLNEVGDEVPQRLPVKADDALKVIAKAMVSVLDKDDRRRVMAQFMRCL